MLVDPFGNRLVACASPKADQGRVEILVEACDPSEAAEFAYTVNGIPDFYSPRYFDPVAATGVRYSFTGAIEEPRQVLRGGYLSWHDVASDMWWQETWFSGDSPTFGNLGRLSAANGSFRSQVDRLTSEATSRAVAPGLRAATVAGLSVASMDLASKNRAARWREQIDSLVRGETRPRGEELLSETGQLAPFPTAQHIDAAKKETRRGAGTAGRAVAARRLNANRRVRPQMTEAGASQAEASEVSPGSPTELDFCDFSGV